MHKMNKEQAHKGGNTYSLRAKGTKTKFGQYSSKVGSPSSVLPYVQEIF